MLLSSGKKFNEAFWKVNKTPKKFQLCGWVTDMASANFNGLAIFYGEDIRSRVRSKVEVKQDDKFVQCDLCNKRNHIICVGISSAYYEKLQNDTKPWFCPNFSKELPFSDVKDKDLCNTMQVQSTSQTHFTNVPDKKSKELIHKF